MENFQGILFLTTNRVGHIDEAFQSRIHISIGYPALDDAAREQIWNNLFRKLGEDFKAGNGPEITYEYDAKAYAKQDAEMRKLQWNGREIRNAFQTVVALATFDAKQKSQANNDDSKKVVPEIREKHLQQVVNMSKDFRQYMLSAHEMIDDADMAYKLGNRDDLYHGGASARRRTFKLQTPKRADRQDDGYVPFRQKNPGMT